jgi:hypothetical protein
MTIYDNLLLGIPSHHEWGGSQVRQNLVNWADVESRIDPHSSMANGSWGKNNIMVIDPNILVIIDKYQISLLFSIDIFLNVYLSQPTHIMPSTHPTPKHVTTTYMPINSKCKLPLFWFLPITLFFVA